MAGELLAHWQVWMFVSRSAPQVSVPCDLPEQAIAEVADDVRVGQPDIGASLGHIDVRKQ